MDIKAKEQAKVRGRISKVNMKDSVSSFYGSAAWKNLRDKKLRLDPLCEDCKDNGFIKEGMDVDHIVEVKDDYSRRLDITNLRTLCRSHHVHKTHRVKQERKNKSIGRMDYC
tara:strand:- start:4188 stop:4523 length:336 start_codon:yes stop_codon:yes gene_type:complete